MSRKKQRLELTWIGKDERPRLEPRVLIEDESLGHAAPAPNGALGITDNLLVKGDNLLALKALEAEYTGKVKCVYADPPFNISQAQVIYEDNVEHSLWLSLMNSRFTSLHRLMSPDGTLFVHIDDHEFAYLTVLLDEIFGRENRVYVVTFKQASARGHKTINPGCVTTTNFILIYAKDKRQWNPKTVAVEKPRDKRYNRFIENFDEPYETWRDITLSKAFAVHKQMEAREAQKFARDHPTEIDRFVMRNADRVIQIVSPDYDSVGAEMRDAIDESVASPDKLVRFEREGYAPNYFRNGQSILFYSKKMKLIDGEYVTGEALTTLWDDVLSNNLHNEGGVKFPKSKKPEALIQRVIKLTTNPGDFVLDSFAGSGTTGAVAHKMGRRWIMVELGDHADTHIVPRLQKVIDGEDKGGVTEAAGWQGGGGYRYYRLAPSLLEKDRWGQYVISKNYKPEMLAEAVCKLTGFTYAPSQDHFWQHGYSTENDFIYVTTRSLVRKELQKLSEEVGAGRSLLVCCKAFTGPVDDLENLTVKKIPNAVLHKCEWGRDDYSLNIQDAPAEPITQDDLDNEDATEAAE